MQIRDAQPADARSMLPLLAELGYPTDEDGARTRIARSRSLESYELWVAEEDDQLLGFLGAHLTWPLARNEAVAQITAMAVGPEIQGRGVGRALVTHFERWALGTGILSVLVTSASRRHGAHRFYESLGYTETGKRFGKPLEA